MELPSSHAYAEGPMASQAAALSSTQSWEGHEVVEAGLETFLFIVQLYPLQRGGRTESGAVCIPQPGSEQVKVPCSGWLSIPRPGRTSRQQGGSSVCTGRSEHIPNCTPTLTTWSPLIHWLLAGSLLFLAQGRQWMQDGEGSCHRGTFSVCGEDSCLATEEDAQSSGPAVRGAGVDGQLGAQTLLCKRWCGERPE